MSSFKNFLKNIEQTIVKLTTLEIRTVVGDYIIAPDNSVQPIAGGELKIFETKINLLDGDVTSQISLPLVSPEYDWVREFHARKEEKGHEIINNNIKAIMSLIELYKTAKSTAAKDSTINLPATEVATEPQTFEPVVDTTTNNAALGNSSDIYQPAQ
jgi:hypothetical protein